MNDDTLQKLAARVARIVAPLAAGARRKPLIQEELLAHLWQAYEQERAHLPDDDTAAEAAMVRLGDTTELAARLQACVPFPEILLSLCGGRKEILMSRWFWLLIGLAAAFFGTGMILPALAKFKEIAQTVGVKARAGDAILGLAVGELIALVGIGFIGYGIIRFVRRAREGRQST